MRQPACLLVLALAALITPALAFADADDDEALAARFAPVV
jgi:hypothetical protein